MRWDTVHDLIPPATATITMAPTACHRVTRSMSPLQMTVIRRIVVAGQNNQHDASRCYSLPNRQKVVSRWCGRDHKEAVRWYACSLKHDTGSNFRLFSECRYYDYRSDNWYYVQSPLWLIFHWNTMVVYIYIYIYIIGGNKGRLMGPVQKYAVVELYERNPTL